MMSDSVRKHFLEVSTYTYAGAYRAYFQSLPDDIPTLGKLVCGQVIHPSFFYTPVSAYLEDRYFGKLSKYPRHRFRNEDDLFVTAAAMTAELFRLDERGFCEGKDVTKRLSVSCRQASVLMSAILKAKGVPCRSRAGFMDFGNDGASYMEHWVNEYWDEADGRWVLIDVDGYYEYESRFGYSQFDLPAGKFLPAAEAWLGVREKTLDRAKLEVGEQCPGEGLYGYLLMDFHALMNNEVYYTFQPQYLYRQYDRVTEDDLRELDGLARLLADPDGNLIRLRELWETTDKFGILTNPGTDLYQQIFS